MLLSKLDVNWGGLEAEAIVCGLRSVAMAGEIVENCTLSSWHSRM
uniref:Uncharacterized protein n=1 Tax=Rhizobium rhizogenes TaxID=359 RepID=A0A7S5DRA6_RHIRH|nr:hypothetical protein pC5.7b_429 [Rhizobium rhizogenes]